MSLYDIFVKTAVGKEEPLAGYKGQVLLIANTASKCGFTPQYQELEELYQTYHEKGLCVLAFPCNQFLGQEPGTNAEIQSFCQLNYGVTFPVFAKIDVRGENAHPLFQYLMKAQSGLFGGAIKWNFTKFLVDRTGSVVARYAPSTTPLSIAPDIEKLL